MQEAFELWSFNVHIHRVNKCLLQPAPHTETDSFFFFLRVQNGSYHHLQDSIFRSLLKDDLTHVFTWDHRRTVKPMSKKMGVSTLIMREESTGGKRS